jgi:protease I
MGTHSLASKYIPVPDSFRATLVGQEVEIPIFDDADRNYLDGYRVALLVSHGPELPEFDVPLQFLRDRGAVVDTITQNWLFDNQPAAPGMIVLAQFLATNVCVRADMAIRDAVVENYDVILTIGGAWNPVLLRTDGDILRFVQDAKIAGRLIASICHGPQFLISTDAFVRNTRITGVADILPDLTNAGFAVEDMDVVYDDHERLLTARNPAALEQFCERLAGCMKSQGPLRFP